MKDKNINKMCFDYASIIACDMANELIELSKNNKSTTKYSKNLLDYLKNNPNRTFYISSPIDRYEQVDENNVEYKDDCNIVLYVDDLPISIITTNYNIDDNQRLSYNYYLIDDDKFKKIISSNKFYILNASDYGLYMVNDNDYYTISYPISENNNFMEDVKKLNVSINSINKNVLDLDLLNKTTFNINIHDYDYIVSEDTLSIINSYLKDNDSKYLGCELIGSIPQYQYYFSNLNNIEVCDYDRENEAYHFKIVKDSKVLGYLSYDSFDEDIQIYEELNEADKADDSSNTNYVNLVNVGYIFADKVIDENPQEASYSYLDKIVIKAIQEKLNN